MTRPVVVLRPEPGNAETAARLAAFGLEVVRLPLFAVAPVEWTPPASDTADAILITSANAIRHGGVGLGELKHLPVVAVGEATAQAARAAGFAVTLVGNRDAAAAAAVARAAGFDRLLHLSGRDRVAVGGEGVVVYASEEIAIPPEAIDALTGSVALLHSARAARRFEALVGAGRWSICIAALSPVIAAVAGSGWESVAAADAPTDAALVALAAPLAH
ncbi:uroporphyrinogen-III synthase [Sphingomonas sp. SUN019]|uniref:uroporphyrinogen-III synthase n=1 Tax=Sphingomonas sp. SUN019 TaxID=2937788 RepID=UPI002164BA0C|nr:uroporphyrinogen-III synthase [Sphingomonas sp. SUN019]UVO50731.1 uroporphyrinogen-III synthase [Sphingomonas sp. SUN019]